MRYWCQLSRWQRWCHCGVLGVLIFCVVVRSLPYLAPVYATQLQQQEQAITFRDRNGFLLGTLLTRDQNHTAVVPLNEISLHFIHAIIAAEDQRFYQHGAVDGWAVGRAIAEALQAKQVVSGASTITMQLARMVQPSPRTLGGKAQEIWLAWRLVAGMSKDEILHAYINRLPMGGNIYGVEAAARVYFGVAAADLNATQASLLAALPNDPNHLNPYDHWDALKRRQAYVLDRMVEDGYLTAEQADHAKAERVSLQSRQQGILAAPHYLFWLANRLPAAHPAQIRTSLDLPLQQFVEAQVRQVVQALKLHNVHQAAAVVLDNHSGEVLAYVGSTDYFAETQMGRNDAVQALRQPGSTLKPFLYELALERRLIRPNTILADVPTHYAIPGAQLYSPTDYSETFQGPVRVRVALANSLNIPAVRVLEKVGVASFLSRLRELGFNHLNQSPDHYGLGLALGSGEVTLWELAHAYQWMAQQGQSKFTGTPATSTPLLQSSTPLAGSAIWALITDMLSDRHARAKSFGVESVLSLPFAAAVKTGTSSDFRDTWTVGFTTDYTVATWVGNFDGQPMRQISGVEGAAPLWNRIVLHLHEQQSPSPFLPPPGLVQRPICALSGARPTPACPVIVQEYFFPEDLTAYEQQADPFYATVAGVKGRSQYQLNLPAEYDEWLSWQPRSPLNSTQSPVTLRIVAPRQGDFFLMDARQQQHLQLKLATTPDQAVEWRLNGIKLATQTTDSVSWIMQPGDWTLDVNQGDQSDRVSFQVRSVEGQATRRGFSVKPAE